MRAGAQRARELLERHPRHLGLAALCVGLALAGAMPAAGLALWLPPGALGLGLACARLTARPGVGFAVAALLLAGAVGGAARVRALDHSALAALAGRQVSLRATLTTLPRPGGFTRSARARVTAGPGEGEALLLRAQLRRPWPRASIGDELEVRGRLERPRNGAAAGFDYVAYLRRAGVRVVLEVERVRPTGHRRGGVAGLVDGLRRRSERALSAGLPNEAAALVRGMVLGQDEAISEPTRQDFQRSGLAHHLAVSGENVLLLALLAQALLGAAGVGRRTRLLAVLVLIALYVPLTGAGPSILRAGAMGACATLAALAGRPGSRWYALLLAVAFTLALNPRSLADVSWQLSFAAVVAIFWLAPRIAARLGRLPRLLAEGAAITAAATILTAPLMAHHFERISLVSLLANLLALPAVAPVMWLGMLSASAGQVWLGAAELLNALNGFCIGYVAAVAHLTARLPGAVAGVELRPWWSVAAAYGGIWAAVVLGPGAWAAARAPARRMAPVAVAAGLCLLAAAALLASGRASGPPAGLRVSFLDVGQGSATLIQTPSGGSVLVDSGPPDGQAADQVADAGVGRLDALVLTHDSLDHVGGGAEAARRLRPRLLLDGGDGSRNAAYREAVAAALDAGARRLPALTGRNLRLGALTLRELWPPPRPEGPRPDGDPNRRAAVFQASWHGFDLLLPSDAESDVTGPLALPDVDAMAVAHHGSADQGLSGELARLRPELAVVSAGAHNPYGHPTAGTLADLRAAGARTYRTDRDGTVRITVERGELRVETER